MPKPITNVAAKDNSSGKARTKKAPKSVLDKIVEAIRNQPGAPKGVSRVALAKYVKSEFDYDNPAAFKLALKRGVSNGILVQTGQSFRVKGDPVVECVENEEDRLSIEDIDIGKDSDEESEIGDEVTVKYVGTLDNGRQFDAAKSFEFVLGAGEVIKGWDQGLVGMKVGGKRKLVIPSKLGYGKRGCTPDIPPNSTLHFVVTMKKISKGNS